MNHETTSRDMPGFSLRSFSLGSLQQMLHERLHTAGVDQTRSWLKMGVLFSVFVVLMALIQFATPDLVGNDGYYHIKIAYLMRVEGFRLNFDWLPLTVLSSQEYVDHHFLYHVLLIPFTLGDLRIGAKLASAIFPSLAFVAIWRLLYVQKVPFAALWSVGVIALSEAFLYRMSMPRAQSLSLLVLILGMHWLLTKRYRLLVPLAFVYVWLYNAFPLILFLVGIYMAAIWSQDRRIVWKPLAYATGGVILGLVVNPYFPQNLLFAARHILPKIADPTATRVGSEWYPYDTGQLMENSGAALIVLLLGLLALGLGRRRMSLATSFSLLATFFFGAMLFQSRRFIEYFPAIVLIFAALSMKPLLRSWLAWPQKISLQISGSRLELKRRHLLGAAFVIVLIPAVWLNLRASQDSVDGTKPYQRYAAASNWLQNHSEEGSRIFQTDWDDFPQLFFHNHYNTYTLGLDPTYMQLYDGELYDQWVQITKGRVDQPADLIRDSYGAGYVFSDLKHESFMETAEADPGLIEVYRDEYAVLYSVIDQNPLPVSGGEE